MLTLTTMDTKDGFSPNWEFGCPSCKKPIRFYSIAQKQCSSCLGHLSFVPGHLIKSTEARVEYHVENS